MTTTKRFEVRVYSSGTYTVEGVYDTYAEADAHAERCRRAGCYAAVVEIG